MCTCQLTEHTNILNIFHLCGYLYFEKKRQRWLMKLITITIVVSLCLFYLLSNSHCHSCSYSLFPSFPLPFSLLSFLSFFLYLFLKCKKKKRHKKVVGREAEQKRKSLVVKSHFHNKLKIFTFCHGSGWKINSSNTKTWTFHVKINFLFNHLYLFTKLLMVVAMRHLS